MPRVRVVVSEDDKESWSEFVEENQRYDSLSDLVRTAVSNEMQEDSGDGGDMQGEMLDALDSIETKVNNNNTELKALRQENIEREEMENVIELIMDEILSKLHIYASDWFDKPARMMR